ncbi:high-affinity iron transporter [Podospora australis]|uniref:High-affinity iron transporter n=1 Tax=Podospora australis TaxID=1536484 RepID=A0AAN7AHI2_9PEZI|nr:high-affinity iron transporter [Podospora australis]
MVQVFSLPIFLVTFREALETVIIVSVLLAFLKQTLTTPADPKPQVYRKLVRQVWLGTALGILICLIVAAALIAVFYTLGTNHWDKHELKYEGAFALVASVIITLMGFALLRIGKMQEKWKKKIEASLAPSKEKKTTMGKIRRIKLWMEKYAMFALPFVTVLREGIEAVVFIAGVTFSAPATSIPLAVICGIAVGVGVGWLLYKGGSTTKLKLFMVLSTCLLYIVAAGLFSRAVWFFEQQKWNELVGGDAAEVGDGPGSYDIDQSVWHVNCCSPTLNGGSGWGFLNAIFGWTNSATYGSVISYNVYWIVVILSFIVMRYREVNHHWPLIKKKAVEGAGGSLEERPQKSGSGVQLEVLSEGKAADKGNMGEVYGITHVV